MQTRKPLKLGNSDFKSVIEANAYFVDKSMFIDEVLNSEREVLLFPRPRRFGKTLNLSMLYYFFDNKEPDNIKLFQKLNIWTHGQRVKQHCGKYSTLFLSFKDAKAKTWADCYELITYEIIKLYRQHRYLMESDLFYSDEKEEFNAIINQTAKSTAYQLSLNRLSQYLERYHNQKVVILIDEYDTPIQAGFDTFYDEAIGFMRNLLSGAFKDNPHLFKGIISGILRVSRESIFSGLNNLSVFSVLDLEFADKFGFTDNEVQAILSDFGVPEFQEQVKAWYNGYNFGQTHSIYNPWSILNYVSTINQGFQPFWTNTSANDLIKREIRIKSADTIRTALSQLIANTPITRDLEANFVFPDLNSRKELLWTLLLYSGYLTTTKQTSRKGYELRIPNYEVKTVFIDTIIEWMEQDLKITKTLLLDTATHLVQNRIPAFEKGFRQIIGDTFSYYDTAKDPEYVYHAYLLGLLAILGDDYTIKSNKESGEGRYDILLIPHDKTQNGIVIEIKQTHAQTAKENDEVFKQRINTALKGALSQINQNRYYQELLAVGIAKNKIVKVPVVFAGKKAFATEK